MYADPDFRLVNSALAKHPSTDSASDSMFSKHNRTAKTRVLQDFLTTSVSNDQSP